MSSKRAAHEAIFGRLNSNIPQNVGISKKGTKTPKQLERYFKGAANHRRIQILLLAEKREGITVEGIVAALNCNFKTVSMHSHKLVQAGLLNKKYLGRTVTHSLSPYGKAFCRFIRIF